jgi:tetratricopeptide (TPR) repeat protein
MSNTMTTPDLAEARRLADAGPNSRDDDLYQWARDAEEMLRALAAEVERLRAQVAPAGWIVRDRSDIEAGAIDIEGPGFGRQVLSDGLSGMPLRMLHAFARAHLAAPAQQADPTRELLQRIVDGAAPGLRAVAADALKTAETYGASVELFDVVNVQLRAALEAPAQQADPGEIAREAKEYALAIFGDGDVRSDLRELNERIDRLAAIAAQQAPSLTVGERTKPLTPSQIERGREEWGGEHHDFSAGVRFAERAHRIGTASQPAAQGVGATLTALRAARDVIETDRDGFVDAHRLRDLRTQDPIAHGLVLVTEGVWIPGDVAQVLHDYDKAIALIDAAPAQAPAAELAETLAKAVEARIALRAEMKAFGLPPTPDHWHQSIAEADEAIAAALAAYRAV